jgi:hypothetical protein
VDFYPRPAGGRWRLECYALMAGATARLTRDFLTCRATGGGTICEGSRTISFGPEPNAPICGTGADAFQIFDTSTLNQRAIRFYNAEGNLTKRIIHDHYRGEWSNPETGAVAPYIQNQNTTDVLAVPGDLATSTQTVTGQIVMRSGPGAPVLVDVGRQVISGGDLVFSAGQHVFTSRLGAPRESAFERGAGPLTCAE